MFQIDNSTAVDVMPAVSGAGAPGWFSDGNPAQGVPATILPAEFLNIIQAELMAILSAAGVAPSKATLNQLLTALRSAGVFQTPALFDNSTKAATMAALQAAGLHFPQTDGIGITANTTLTAAQAGMWVEVQTAAVTLTLPALASVPKGAAYTICATQAFTLKGNGAEVISPVVGTGGNTYAGQMGETLVVVSNGPALGWYVAIDGLASSQMLGQTQTMQNVLGSRALGTTYYNTTGRPIFVNVQGTSSAAGASMIISVNGTNLIGSGSSVAAYGIAAFAIVPPGASYSASVTTGTGTLQNWLELR